MARDVAQLGQFLTLSLFTESKTTRNTAATPDNAPTYSIYNAGGTVLENKPLPKWGFGTTGLYGMDLLLNSTFAVGDYCAHFEWEEGGTANARIMPFTVQPGSPSTTGRTRSSLSAPRKMARSSIAAIPISNKTCQRPSKTSRSRRPGTCSFRTGSIRSGSGTG
jgi:hypothetical protein